MNPVALQVNKEVDHEDVVGLVDHVLLVGKIRQTKITR
jgi:hypothetical protein